MRKNLKISTMNSRFLENSTNHLLLVMFLKKRPKKVLMIMKKSNSKIIRQIIQIKKILLEEVSHRPLPLQKTILFQIFLTKIVILTI